MLIGICGKSGSGKSTLSKKIAKEVDGIYLDIDKIGHKVLTYKDVQKELVKSFGTGVYDGHKIDRKKLGELVFNSRDKMKKLSDITWTYMEMEIDSIINSNKNKVIIFDYILLPLTKYYNMCNFKILLDVPYNIRKERAMLRDNISSEDFALREKASIDFNVDDFDYVLEDNNINVRRLLKLL